MSPAVEGQADSEIWLDARRVCLLEDGRHSLSSLRRARCMVYEEALRVTKIWRPSFPGGGVDVWTPIWFLGDLLG